MKKYIARYENIGVNLFPSGLLFIEKHNDWTVLKKIKNVNNTITSSEVCATLVFYIDKNIIRFNMRNKGIIPKHTVLIFRWQIVLKGMKDEN